MHKAVNAAEEGAARREQNGTLGVLPNAEAHASATEGRR
jgi:hypothetical protein